MLLPSNLTEVGRKILAEHPGTTGSLGCAISEAVETAVSSDGYRYVFKYFRLLDADCFHQALMIELGQGGTHAVIAQAAGVVGGRNNNQVLLHQSVIGLETKTALDKYGVKPDIIIGCAGGGSNWLAEGIKSLPSVYILARGQTIPVSQKS